MWKLLALLMHILMLGFISLIYYQTTIINGLKPQLEHRELDLQPPADRLVVFLIDGLRAESILRHNCSAVPRLRKLFLDNGLVGVSQGQAPTETRPGHIAIFGGFNEDAAAALTNFRRNPSTFDTVLNRTRGRSWAWGAKSVLEFLMYLPTDGVPINLDMHTHLDFMGNLTRHQWIFEKVSTFLSSQEKGMTTKETLPSVYIVDFDELHRLGHVPKPNSDEFVKSLSNTEDVIVGLHNQFEATFKDKRTVYLLTSDHGMTDKGCHGGDSNFEIEMPFIFWGAGVKRNVVNPVVLRRPNDSGLPMELQKLEQTQLAPLMSALIGLPPPINNRARLPLGLMNVSIMYEAESLHMNALQMLEQAERVLELGRRSNIYNWLPRFERLDRRRIRNYRNHFPRQIRMGCFVEAIKSSEIMILTALDCLEYYSVYYRIPLVLACISSYLGWFFYLLAKQSRPANELKQGCVTVTSIMLVLLEIMVLVICYLHRVPCCTSFYLLVPLPIWMLAMQERGVRNSCLRGPLIQLAWIGGTALLLIATLFYEQLIAVVFLIAVCANNGSAFTRAPRLRFWVWLALVALLTGFTVKRPDFGENSHYLLCLSMLVTMLRPLILSERHAYRVWVTNGAALLLAAYLAQQRINKHDVSPLLQFAAWLYVVIALISIPYSDTKVPRRRVQLILFNLSTIYTMMCISYESIFMQLLCMEFVLGVQVRQDYKRRSSAAHGEDAVDAEEQEEEEDEDEEEEKPDKLLNPVDTIHSCYRYAVLILVYAYISMIGTGSLPNHKFIDVSVARVFVSDCSSVLIGFIVVLKLMIPVVIITSSMYAFCARARQNLCGIFICIFLICDVMCLYFFFFVRNSGSWRNVRESLSQQILVHGMPMLLAIFSWMPKQLLSAIPLTMLPMLRWKSTINLVQPGQSQA